MAAGTPVIAYRAGGALDYVKPGVTGEFFEKQTVTELARALRQFNGASYSSAAVRAYAQKFSKEKFQVQIKHLVTRSLQEQRIRKTGIK